MTRILPLFLLWMISSCSHTIYIVRHAEKETTAANMGNDVPLTETGEERAVALKELLAQKKITEIYSTNTIRTKSTAQPTADYFRVSIQLYDPVPDPAFINTLKSLKGNVLIVGHSNTVDDIANMLCGKTVIQGDLKDTEYDNLFEVIQKGKKIFFKRKKFGKAAG